MERRAESKQPNPLNLTFNERTTHHHNPGYAVAEACKNQGHKNNEYKNLDAIDPMTQKAKNPDPKAAL